MDMLPGTPGEEDPEIPTLSPESSILGYALMARAKKRSVESVVSVQRKLSKPQEPKPLSRASGPWATLAWTPGDKEIGRQLRVLCCPRTSPGLIRGAVTSGSAAWSGSEGVEG